MALAIGDDYTLMLLSSDLEPDVLVEATAQVDVVGEDEWFVKGGDVMTVHRDQRSEEPRHVRA